MVSAPEPPNTTSLPDPSVMESSSDEPVWRVPLAWMSGEVS